jgi:hypothetical protein
LLSFSSVSWAAEGPGFGDRLIQESDIRYSFTLAPDNKTLSVLFDNLRVELPAHRAEPLIATRTFTLSIPIKDGATGTSVGMDLRGAVQRTEGANVLLVLWVNGRSTVIDLSTVPYGDFERRVDATLDAASECQLIFVLMAERDAQPGEVGAMLDVDSLDVVIKPGTP